MLLRTGHRRGRTVVALLALLAFPVLFGVDVSCGDFETVSRQAAEAREAGRLIDAVKLYRQAVELRPEWLEGLWYLGTLLYDGDRHAEARDYFERLVELAPENGLGWAFLGLCDFRTGEYDSALSSLRKARSIGVGQNAQLEVVVRYHLAILLSHKGRFEDALEALKAFAINDIRTPDIIEAFGLASLRMNWLPTEVPPKRRELILEAGTAAYEAAAYHFDAAEKAYQKLVEQYPEEPIVHYAFGAALSAMRGLQGHSRDDAMGQFEAELKVSPNHLPSLLQLAMGYIELGRFDEALPYAEQALQIDPSSFVAYYALGQIRFEEGQLPEALDALKKAAELDPMSPEVRFTLARAYQKAGMKDEAARERAEFERLSKLKKESMQILQ